MDFAPTTTTRLPIQHHTREARPIRIVRGFGPVTMSRGPEPGTPHAGISVSSHWSFQEVENLKFKKRETYQVLWAAKRNRRPIPRT